MVGKDKIRTTITLPIELKVELEQIAKEENRSLNNIMVYALKLYASKATKR